MKNKNLFDEKIQLILLGVLRTFLGFIFIWAFFDKTFGLGFATPKGSAWINGVSPTAGYLSNLIGTFSNFFSQFSGLFAIDLIFMAGLFVIGLCQVRKCLRSFVYDSYVSFSISNKE